VADRATWWHGQHDLDYMRLDGPRGRQALPVASITTRRVGARL
jgi:hypothetical protein